MEREDDDEPGILNFGITILLTVNAFESEKQKSANISSAIITAGESITIIFRPGVLVLVLLVIESILLLLSFVFSLLLLLLLLRYRYLTEVSVCQ
mmetsp:Transcript_41549/g.58478  ORF Transcript_41549/g.58478 Transcript_41549/m.58478 type:complete len:95 (+) Transcript_41549:856-1140(+)